MGYGGRGLGVDQSKQYGHFDHHGVTSAVPKSPLGLQENEEDHGPIPYTTLEDEPKFTSGTGYSSMGLKEGFHGIRDEYDRSRAMAELPIGYTPRQNEIVDYGGSSIALSEGFRGEFNRSREMGHGGCSQGQTARHDELVDNAGGSSEALNEVFRGRSRAMAEGPGGSHAEYSQGLAPRHLHGSSPIALNEDFCCSDEFNKSRAMAEGPIGHGGYSHGQTPRKNELMHPRWAQQSPKEEMGRDYKVPGMKRNDNGDMDALFLLDLLYKKMASVGEDSRPPSHLTPSVVDSVVYRVAGSNSSVGAGTHENCQLDQYHDYMEPTNVFPNHQSTSEPSIPCYDEVLDSSNSRTEVCRSNETQCFRLGVDVDHERVVKPLSYEGNLQGLALPDEDQGLLEAYGGCQQRLAAAESLASMTPLGRWALRKVAMKEQQSGNHSKSKFFPDLNPSCNARNSSYEVDTQLTTTEDMQQQYANEDIQQYAATCGEDQWNMEQNVICGDGQWNFNQGVTRGVDQRNTEQGSIDQGVTRGVDQRNIAQGLTLGEDQCNNDQGGITDGEQQEDQWNNDQGITTSGEQQWRMCYGGDQWNAEHINNLNSDSLLPNSELPASTQEHYGEQSKSARIHVNERLGPPKLSTRSIKKRLRPPMKSPGSVKMRLGPSPNDPNINILGFKHREQYKSRIRKTDDFSGNIHPQGDGIPKAKTDAAVGNYHPQ